MASSVLKRVVDKLDSPAPRSHRGRLQTPANACDDAASDGRRECRGSTAPNLVALLRPASDSRSRAPTQILVTASSLRRRSHMSQPTAKPVRRHTDASGVGGVNGAPDFSLTPTGATGGGQLASNAKLTPKRGRVYTNRAQAMTGRSRPAISRPGGGSRAEAAGRRCSGFAVARAIALGA